MFGVLVIGMFYGMEEEFKRIGIFDKLFVGGRVEVNVMDWLGSLVYEVEVVVLILSDFLLLFYSKLLVFCE